MDITATTSIISDGTVRWVEFNAASTKCCIITSKSIRVYDTTTWLQDCEVYHDESTTVYNGGFSKDGLKVAYVTNVSPFIYSVQLSAGSVAPISNLPTPVATEITSSSKASDSNGILYVNNDTEMLVLWGGSINSYPYYTSVHRIISVSTGLEVHAVHTSSNTANNPSGRPKLSPDGTLIAFPLANKDLAIVTVSTGAIFYVDYEYRYVDNSQWPTKYVHWWGNDQIMVGGNITIPAIGIFTISENAWTTKYTLNSTCKTYGITNPSFHYEVSGTIVESLLVTDWRCSAYSIKDSQLVGSVDVTGNSFTIPLPTNEMVMVVVHPVPATRWKLDTLYTVGKQVYPTNANATPFYYVCTTAGSSGITEPTWGTVVGGDTLDGSAVWELVERISQPVAQMPLSPTAV